MKCLSLFPSVLFLSALCGTISGFFADSGLHGYSHENPVKITWEQQRDALNKSYRLVTEFCGKPLRGNVVPWWECSEKGTELMLKYGIEYDYFMLHHDCQPYYLRMGDKWTKIDYKKKAEEWMKLLVKGQESGLVEIPRRWYIDDLPPMVTPVDTSIAPPGLGGGR